MNFLKGDPFQFSLSANAVLIQSQKQSVGTSPADFITGPEDILIALIGPRNEFDIRMTARQAQIPAVIHQDFHSNPQTATFRM